MGETEPIYTVNLDNSSSFIIGYGEHQEKEDAFVERITQRLVRVLTERDEREREKREALEAELAENRRIVAKSIEVFTQKKLKIGAAFFGLFILIWSLFIRWLIG